MTCDYWNEIWLNEGFATYFEDVASDALLPSYGILDTFYPYTTVGALVTDARSQSTHPLSVPAGGSGRLLNPRSQLISNGVPVRAPACRRLAQLAQHPAPASLDSR